MTFWLVFCAPALLVTELVNAIGCETYNRDPNRAGYPESYYDGGVNITPVRGDFRPPPWTSKVEYDRADPNKEQCVYCYRKHS